MVKNNQKIIYVVVELILTVTLCMFIFIFLVAPESQKMFFVYMGIGTAILMFVFDIIFRGQWMKKGKSKNSIQEPVDVLKKSLAEGKISIKEYEERKKILQKE